MSAVDSFGWHAARRPLASAVGLAYVFMLGVAVVDLATRQDAALADLLTACPALAAASGTRRQVIAVGAACLAVAGALALGAGVVSDADFAIAVVGISLSTLVAQVVAARRTETEERAQWLISIVEQARAATMSFDLDGRVTAWNEESVRLLGRPAGRAVGSHVDDVVPTSVPGDMDGLLARVGAGHNVEEHAAEWHRQDGSAVPVSVSGFPLRDTNGDVVGATVVASDRSAVREAEEERDRLATRLAQSERLDSLGQLAGGIAHDFNNLLAVLLSYVGLARGRTDDPRLLGDLDKISAVTDRASSLTRKLLTFSSDAPSTNEVADVNAAFVSLSDLLERTLPANVTVVPHLDAGLWSVPIDATMIEQIMMNLVLNARDALPDGGTITVETANEVVNGHVTTAPPTLPRGRYVRVAVSDDGVGMTAEVRDRAFEPLFTTKSRGEGTGFGLATVYGICRRAGGVASIYSEEGRGTTVRMHLPAADDHVPVPEPELEQFAVPSVSSRRVLLVEDNEMLREPLVEILEGAGFEVMVASSAEHALEILDASDPDPVSAGEVDLLVSDVMMPGRSGPQLAEELRTRDPNLPVLLLSGYTARTVGVLPAQSGYAFLEKPFNLEEFLAKVTEAIASR